MLDRVDLSRSVGKAEYQRRLPQLQQRLYDLEVETIASHIPVAIVFEGWAGTSKIGTIGGLTRRLDPRGLRIHPITPPTAHDRHFPWLKRFWECIPAYGEIAIFDRSWYREVLEGRARKQLSRRAYLERCEDIVSFERQLAEDGVIILKFSLHISKQEQQRRFEQLLGNRLTAIQVTKSDMWQNHHYNRVLRVTEDLIARTDTAHAPWTLVPANDRQYAQLMVMESIVQRLEQRVQAHELVSHEVAVGSQNGHVESLRSVGGELLTTSAPAPTLTPLGVPSILRRLDLSKTIEQDEYERKLAKLQAKLYLLGLEAYRQKRPVLLVFEGWDAAGKGGTIKRITERLDPRAYVVHAIAKPEGEDKEHHYLYRFWRRLPPRGQIAIFDRSWYGRVLVERVEGFARPDEWQRAYAEINEFERQLVDFGTIICKFWLHVSPEEQLRRFEERKSVRYKAWKLTEEDWRNREKWPLYEQAVDEMVLRTNTPCAPWNVVASEDKHVGRIETLRAIVRRMESELGKVKL